jgi:hypothetical protein
MTVTINGTSGIAGVDGSAGTPAIQGGDTNTGMFFPAADTIAFSEGGTEVMRIDSSSNVGIGTTSADVKLSVNGSVDVGPGSVSTPSYGFFPLSTYGGTGIYAPAANTVGFTTAGTERMRIDSSGNLQLGYGGQTTTAFAAPQGITIGSLDNVALQYYLRKGNQVEAHIGFKASTDTNLYVGTGGGAGPGGIGVYGLYQANVSTSWTAVSDERFKTELQPIENALEKVAGVRAVTGRYSYDEENGSTKRRAFLIAQDFLTALPEAVDTQDPEKYGLSYSDTIPLLFAAIKEQQTLITALTARIEALEAK